MNLVNLFSILGKFVETTLKKGIYKLRNKHNMLEKGQYDFHGEKSCFINLLIFSHFFEESINM